MSLPCLLHGQADSLPLSHQGSPDRQIETFKSTLAYFLISNCKHPCLIPPFSILQKVTALPDIYPTKTLNDRVSATHYTLCAVLCLVTQLCLTLCDPMDCRLPGSSVHGILQTRKLEWVAIPFTRGYSQLRNWTQVSCIAGRSFTICVTGKPTSYSWHLNKVYLNKILSLFSIHSVSEQTPEKFVCRSRSNS